MATMLRFSLHVLRLLLLLLLRLQQQQQRGVWWSEFDPREEWELQLLQVVWVNRYRLVESHQQQDLGLWLHVKLSWRVEIWRDAFLHLWNNSHWRFAFYLIDWKQATILTTTLAGTLWSCCKEIRCKCWKHWCGLLARRQGKSIGGDRRWLASERRSSTHR